MCLCECCSSTVPKKPSLGSSRICAVSVSVRRLQIADASGSSERVGFATAATAESNRMRSPLRGSLSPS